jgi:hypothetical protein
LSAPHTGLASASPAQKSVGVPGTPDPAAAESRMPQQEFAGRPARWYCEGPRLHSQLGELRFRHITSASQRRALSSSTHWADRKLASRTAAKLPIGPPIRRSGRSSFFPWMRQAAGDDEALGRTACSGAVRRSFALVD